MKIENKTESPADYIVRLEQENKNLKKEVKQIGSDFIKKGDYARELEKENKELKKQIESQKGLITVGSKQQYDMTIAYDKCKSALEEIRHILTTNKEELEECLYHNYDEQILNKINEVLNAE